MSTAVNTDQFPAGQSIVTIDRRREREKSTETNPPAVRKERRRQIDPTTCERDYSGDEVEFMTALDTYKRKSGRMFPTCSEILEVIRSLGYSKPEAAVVTGDDHRSV